MQAPLNSLDVNQPIYSPGSDFSQAEVAGDNKTYRVTLEGGNLSLPGDESGATHGFHAVVDIAARNEELAAAEAVERVKGALKESPYELGGSAQPLIYVAGVMRSPVGAAAAESLELHYFTERYSSRAFAALRDRLVRWLGRLPRKDR